MSVAWRSLVTKFITFGTSYTKCNYFSYRCSDCNDESSVKGGLPLCDRPIIDLWKSNVELQQQPENFTEPYYVLGCVLMLGMADLNGGSAVYPSPHRLSFVSLIGSANEDEADHSAINVIYLFVLRSSFFFLCWFSFVSEPGHVSHSEL